MAGGEPLVDGFKIEINKNLPRFCICLGICMRVST